jgi:formate hydrogenlyase subunit 3/multisubunit Na+/H+ antiporter MnhD subunit
MLSAILFLAILFLSLLIFFVPGKVKYFFTLALIVIGIVVTTLWSSELIAGDGQEVERTLLSAGSGSILVLTIDRLSALFVLVINITVLTGFLYARGYLARYLQTKSSLSFSIHYFSYLWLWLSMLMVVMVRDGLSFLIVWEIMALSSFFLVIFQAEERTILKTGINYLIQMHVGMFFIMTGFLLVGRDTGIMSFNALTEYFSSNPNFPLFLLFFIGFAIKAGFIPLHTWLPEAHPSAPSHVSGVMSGVMIKMGIYGIIRVLMAMQSDLLLTGTVILAVSLFTGVMGIMMAIVQNDLKRLLAYSSIENIGIIGTGIGLGMIGLGLDNPVLAVLGFAGGLLHVLNHSLFKSLLFFNAGSVYRATHTRNMEELGGVMKRMPYTALLFLTGSLAICGLPPFNGFISEYFIYMGLFRSLAGATLTHSIVIVASVVGLSLIGGLAIFCFTKAFGIVFLGEPRSQKAVNISEMGRTMILPQLLTVLLIMIIGLGSPLVVRPMFEMVAQSFGVTMPTMETGSFMSNLSQISIIGGLFVLMLTLLLVYRRLHLKRRQVEAGPTWGCGYTAATPRMQYTATSFAYNYNHIAKPLLQNLKIMDEIREDDLFPVRRTFESHSDDLFRRYLIDRPVDWVSGLLKKIAVMQTGRIQQYILYAFLFMLLVLLLSFLEII